MFEIDYPFVVLAGGLGTRMKSTIPDVPKSLIPVRGRPFIEWQLEWLVEQGVRDVILCIGHRGGDIRRHVGTGASFGIRATYVDEGDSLRGTAGALRLAVDEDGDLDAVLRVVRRLTAGRLYRRRHVDVPKEKVCPLS